MFRDLGMFALGVLTALVVRPIAEKAYEKTTEWKHRKEKKAEAAVPVKAKADLAKVRDVARTIKLSDIGLNLNELVAKSDDNDDNVVVIGKEEFSKLMEEAKTAPVEAK